MPSVSKEKPLRLNIVDVDGEDWYIFSSSGQYREKVEMEGQHRIAIHSTETLESGDTYDHYRFVDFADPENDPKSIDNGEIDKITEISEEEIYHQLTNQGVSNASKIDSYKESGGGGAFDYYTTVIPLIIPSLICLKERMLLIMHRIMAISYGVLQDIF